MNPIPPFDAARALQLAARTFEIEARALTALAARLDDSFAQAVQAVLNCQGRVVVMGMGKSGHVGRKIAATLASTGTPAMFVHPAEASHGDLGMVIKGDVVLAISNSGESDELAAILPSIKRLGVTFVAMTGKAQSTLARHADIVLNSAVGATTAKSALAVRPLPVSVAVTVNDPSVAGPAEIVVPTIVGSVPGYGVCRGAIT